MDGAGGVWRPSPEKLWPSLDLGDPEGGQVAIAVGTRKGLWDPSQRVHLAGAESQRGFRCVLRPSSMLCFHSPQSSAI